MSAPIKIFVCSKKQKKKKMNILYLQTVLIKQKGPMSQYRMQVSSIFTENLIVCSAKANTSLETKNISSNL